MRAADRRPIPTSSWVALALAVIAGVTTLACHPRSWLWSDVALFGASVAATIAILRFCLHRPAVAHFRGRTLDEGVRVEGSTQSAGYREQASGSGLVVIDGSFRRATTATLASMVLGIAAALPCLPRHSPGSASCTLQLGLAALMLALALGCLRRRWRVAVSRDARTLTIGRTSTCLPRPATLRTRHISAGKRSRDVLELVHDAGHVTLLRDSVETLGALTSTAHVIADVLGEVTVIEHVGPLPKPSVRMR
jgi:hypothetical protein